MGLLADNNGGIGILFDMLIKDRLYPEDSFENLFDRNIFNDSPSSCLSEAFSNEHMKGIENLIEVTNAFLEENKNNGLFLLTIYDTPMENDQVVKNFLLD